MKAVCQILERGFHVLENVSHIFAYSCVLCGFHSEAGSRVSIQNGEKKMCACLTFTMVSKVRKKESVCGSCGRVSSVIARGTVDRYARVERVVMGNVLRCGRCVCVC